MFRSLKRGMKRTRERFSERMNVLFDRGPDVDEDFWDGLEEALIESDVGAQTADEIVEGMRDESKRQAMSDGYEVMDALVDEIAEKFAQSETNVFDENPVTVLFVGVNGAGKTTTCGKIAAAENAADRKVIMGNADTFRAAAREQLDIWARRSGVEVVERDRGADPASVCYDTLERAEQIGSDMVLIDTAGRLHTSADLMRELQKVVNVVRKRSTFPVKVVLVLDATTGQNGITQAHEFDKALHLDGLIVTKLDGTARGGIALNVSHELGLPIAKVGVGEQVDDLQDFDPYEYAAALIGAEPEDEQDASEEPRPAVQAQEMAQHGVALEREQETPSSSASPEEDAAQTLESDEQVESAEDSVEEEETFEETGSIEETKGSDEDSGSNEDAEAASDSVDGEEEDSADSNEDAPERSAEPADSDEEETGHKKGRMKRLFRWHRRKDR